jgi:YHS domain-containing protein
MARDPVCGMQIDVAAPGAQFEYVGETFYFCSLGCKRDFEHDPERYVRARADS